MIICDHCEGTGAEEDYTPTSEELLLEIFPRACEICGGAGTLMDADDYAEYDWQRRIK